MLEARASDGSTALHQAAAQGTEEMVQALLSCGADTQALDEEARTPLHWATRNSSVRAFKAVLKQYLRAGGDINARDVSGMTVISWAAFHGRAPTIDLLLKNGANPSMADFEGKTCQHWAVHRSSNAALTACVGAELHLDSKGRTACHVAAEKGCANAAMFLLERFPQSRDQTDRNGRTPLHWAAACNHSAVVKILLDKGADTLAVDTQGLTALNYAVGKRHHMCVMALTSAMGISATAAESSMTQRSTRGPLPPYESVADVPDGDLPPAYESDSDSSHAASPAPPAAARDARASLPLCSPEPDAEASALSQTLPRTYRAGGRPFSTSSLSAAATLADVMATRGALSRPHSMSPADLSPAASPDAAARGDGPGAAAAALSLSSHPSPASAPSPASSTASPASALRPGGRAFSMPTQPHPVPSLPHSISASAAVRAAPATAAFSLSATHPSQHPSASSLPSPSAPPSLSALPPSYSSITIATPASASMSSSSPSAQPPSASSRRSSPPSSSPFASLSHPTSATPRRGNMLQRLFTFSRASGARTDGMSSSNA